MRNKDCTSFEIEISVRERMREVARLLGMNMKEYLLLKIEEDEKSLGLMKKNLEFVEKRKSELVDGVSK